MQCIITENNQIKLTLNDTKKMAHDSQIERAKENLKLSYHTLPCSIKDSILTDLDSNIFEISEER